MQARCGLDINDGNVVGGCVHGGSIWLEEIGG